MENVFDFIIVGAGSSGSVIANRLSANPKNKVLLLEAGSIDNHPYITIPKGISKLVKHPKFTWAFPIEQNRRSDILQRDLDSRQGTRWFKFNKWNDLFSRAFSRL